MEANFTNLHAYTTGTDPNWSPINYTITKDGLTQVVSIQEYSDFYDTPLPGDMAVTFSSTNQVPEFSTLSILLLFAVIILFSIVFVRKGMPKNSPHSFY
jgi:hypothetical protein